MNAHESVTAEVEAEVAELEARLRTGAAVPAPRDDEAIRAAAYRASGQETLRTDRLVADARAARQRRMPTTGIRGRVSKIAEHTRRQDRQRFADLLWAMAEKPDAELNDGDGEFLYRMCVRHGLDDYRVDLLLREVGNLKLARVSLAGAQTAVAELMQTPRQILGELAAIDAELLAAVGPIMARKRDALERLEQNRHFRAMARDAAFAEPRMRLETPLIFPDAPTNTPDLDTLPRAAPYLAAGGH